MSLNRRDFFKATAALASANLLASLPRLAFRAEGNTSAGDILVCIFQRGAADGLNMIVPHGDRDYYEARDTIAIAQPHPGDPKAAVDLDGFFGLHPALKPLDDIYRDRALAIVHAVGSPDPTHSHFDAMDFMERGTPGAKAVTTGWIGRHLQTMGTQRDESPFRAVGVGAMLQQSLRGPVQAVALQSIADFHLKGRQDEVAKLQAVLSALYSPSADMLEATGQRTFDAIQMLTRINPGAYKPANGAKYPTGRFGEGLTTVAQLIKADVGLEVACVDIGGWDTHMGEGGADGGELPRLLQEFGEGLAAFHLDMQDRMGHITVVTMSEFGRRVQENSSHGTDHGHGNAMILMGGGVQGGKVYADWPGLALDRRYGPGDLAVTTDFRDVLGELVQKRLGNPELDVVFPNYTPAHRGIFRSA